MAAGTSVQSVASSVPFHDFCSLLERVSTSRGTEKKKKLLSTFLEQWRSAHRALHGGDTASAVSAVKHSRRALRAQHAVSRTLSCLCQTWLASLSSQPYPYYFFKFTSHSHHTLLPYPALPLPPFPSCPSLRPLPGPPSCPLCSTQSDSFFPAMRLLVPQVDKDRLPYGMKEVSSVFWDH